MTDKIQRELALEFFCKPCGASCCYRGSPLYLPEEREAVVAEHPDHFEEIGSNFVIPKPQGFCPYLNGKKECSIHELKGIDCQIYPLDPLYEGGFVEFVMDVNCSAHNRLTPDFIATAVFQGAEWIKKFSIEDFNAYWDVFKRDNPKQSYLTVFDFLKKKDRRFLEKTKKKLAERVRSENKTLYDWNNRIFLKTNLAEILS